ncbi:hypothetical protein CEXT_268531 [Caerostris extrusa]|uniref:Uncharacterized protein n=1 Tax=Caerostris extrusa TaxID=172846 RepID=A0AAV4VD12_CAEEX|nr:hypothetical protein CEXT_268531 [Caerostris extrusa]
MEEMLLEKVITESRTPHPLPTLLRGQLNYGTVWLDARKVRRGQELWFRNLELAQCEQVFGHSTEGWPDKPEMHQCHFVLCFKSRELKRARFVFDPA